MVWTLNASTSRSRSAQSRVQVTPKTPSLGSHGVRHSHQPTRTLLALSHDDATRQTRDIYRIRLVLLCLSTKALIHPHATAPPHRHCTGSQAQRPGRSGDSGSDYLTARCARWFCLSVSAPPDERRVEQIHGRRGWQCNGRLPAFLACPSASIATSPTPTDRFTPICMCLRIPSLRQDRPPSSGADRPIEPHPSQAKQPGCLTPPRRARPAARAFPLPMPRPAAAAPRGTYVRVLVSLVLRETHTPAGHPLAPPVPLANA